ncbi:hypothetical protein [Mesonia aestuariivivens]|uniref:Transposase n=1 Tax=Mesonia aestuariivivens TaxID=2796128 RepID=A0ABS6W343_9FLAO|nr:hypothetical protein [Mesonia aestuariivivens]MBW2962287.1 hypothetical protein [Mesonia aestuariivivens]
MRTAKNCTCGRSKKVYCPNCSRIRMIICLKNGHDNLKLTAANGNKYNPVWYNFLKDNRKDMGTICKKMEEKVRLHPEYGQAANVLLFYLTGNRSNYIHKVQL